MKKLKINNFKLYLILSIYSFALLASLFIYFNYSKEKVLKKITDTNFGRHTIKDRDSKFFKKISYYLLKVLRYNIRNNSGTNI